MCYKTHVLQACCEHISLLASCERQPCSNLLKKQNFLQLDTQPETPPAWCKFVIKLHQARVHQVQLAFLTPCDQAFNPPFLGGKIIELAKFCFKNKSFEPSLSFFSKQVIVSHCV